MEDYHAIRKIGDGSQGVVYEVEHVYTRRRYALKIMSCANPEHVNLALREIKVLLQLRHPHIVSYVDFFLTFNNSEMRRKLTKSSCTAGAHVDVVTTASAPRRAAGDDMTAAYQNNIHHAACTDDDDDDHMHAMRTTQDRRVGHREGAANWIDADEMAVCLVTELCVNGDMSDAIVDAKRKMMLSGAHPIPETQILEWISQCTSALLFIHRKGFLHRDLKPTNIFFDSDRNIKMGDFGLAATVGFGRSTTVGTPFYLAPERVLQQRYNAKVDIWGVGVVVLELLTLQDQPVNGMVLENPLMVTSSITKQIVKRGFSHALASLVCDMLQRYPDDRPDPETVLQRLAALHRPCDPFATPVISPGSSLPCPCSAPPTQQWPPIISALGNTDCDGTAMTGAVCRDVGGDMSCSACDRPRPNCGAAAAGEAHNKDTVCSSANSPMSSSHHVDAAEETGGEGQLVFVETTAAAAEVQKAVGVVCSTKSHEGNKDRSGAAGVYAANSYCSSSNALSRREVSDVCAAVSASAAPMSRRTVHVSLLPPPAMCAPCNVPRPLARRGAETSRHDGAHQFSSAEAVHPPVGNESDTNSSNGISNKSSQSRTDGANDTYDICTLRVPQDYATLHAALGAAMEQRTTRQILVAGGTVIHSCVVLDRRLPDGICLRGIDPAPVIEVAEGGFAVHCTSGRGVMVNFAIRHVGSSHTRLSRAIPPNRVDATRHNDDSNNTHATKDEVGAAGTMDRGKSPRPTAVWMTGGEWRLHRCHISCLDGSGVSVSGVSQTRCASDSSCGGKPAALDTRGEVDGVCGSVSCVLHHPEESVATDSRRRGVCPRWSVAWDDNSDNDEEEEGVGMCAELAPTITQCTFTEVTTAGVVIAERVGGLYQSNTLIGCGFSAFFIKRESTARVCANTIRECGESGIFCHNGAGVVEHNTITANVGCGIVVKGPLAAPIVRNNTIAQNMQAGVLCCDQAEPLIMDNDIVRNRHACVIIRDGASPKVIHNTIKHGNKAGVYVLQSGSGLIEGNTISDNSNAGVLVTTQARPCVVHNVISCNAYEGVWVCNKGGGTFCNNVIYDNVRGARDIDVNSTVTWIDNSTAPRPREVHVPKGEHEALR